MPARCCSSTSVPTATGTTIGLPDEEDEDEVVAARFGPHSAQSVTPDICPVCGNVTFVSIEGAKCFSWI